MNYRDRQARNRIESEKAYYSTPKTDNKAIQIGAKKGETGRFSVIHTDGGVTSNGDKAFNASAPQDGFVRGNASGNVIALEYRNIKRESIQPIQDEEETSKIVILFRKDNALYIGGDRSEPEIIYALEDGYSFVGSPNINKTGNRLDDWIVNFILQEDSDGDNYMFCVITSNDVIQKPVNLPQSVDGNTFGGVGGLGISCFQHGYFSSISITNVSFLSDANPACSILGSGYDYGFYAALCRVTVTFDGLSFILAQDISGLGFPISVNADLYGDLGQYYIPEGETTPTYTPLVGDTANIATIAPYNKASDIILTNTSVSSDVRYTNPLNIGGTVRDISTDRWAVINNGSTYDSGKGRTVALIEGVYCPVVSTHRTIGLDVLNLADIDVEYINLLTNESRTIDLPFTKGQTILARQISDGDGFSPPKTKDEPFCVGLNQDSAILKVYDSETATVKLNFRKGSESIFLNLEDFEGVFSPTAKSPNLIDSNIYAVSSFPEDDAGNVDIFVSSIGEDVLNSTETLPYIGIPEDFKNSIIDASAYLL